MRKRLRGEQGVALVIAVMSMTLMTALGAALILTTMTETGISANYVGGIEAFYAADAAVERTVAELPAADDWHALIGVRFDGPAEALVPAVPTASQIRIVLSVAAAEVEGGLVVRAEASGPRGVDRTVEATVSRTDGVGPAGIRVLAWKEVR
jgi:hypothetical protein